MKSLIWAGYMVLTFLGIAILVRRNDPPPTPRLRAAAALPAGRQLVTGDVMLGNGPRYLRRAVPAGGAITAADLLPVPVVVNAGGFLPLAFNLPAGGPLLNIGDKAWLCPTTTAPANPAQATPAAPVTNAQATPADPPLKVISTTCAGPACLAIIAVPADRAASLASLPHVARAQPCR